MYQILESIAIALQSIWASKLRSFMTVLGNIVAVTSIVTVVSLIQGMNAMVSSAIVTDVGADGFTIQRRPITRTEEEEERTRNNPNITLAEADAVKAFSPVIASVVAQANRPGTITYRDQILENIQIQGVTGEYVNFTTFDAERGRLMSPTEVERNQPLAVIGYDVAEQLFGDLTPLDRIIKIQGIHFRVVGVSEKKGSVFGNSMDQFAVIPIGAHMKLFGSRPNLSLMVKPVSTEVLPTAMDDATVALRVARRLKPAEPDNFGIFTSDTLLGLYRQATNGIFAVLVGIVALSLTRELAPVLTALMVNGRVGSAMAAELGTMRVTEQVDALESMAIDPMQYLVAPRLLATVVMVPALTMIFNVIGLAGCWYVAVQQLQVPEGGFWARIWWFVDEDDVLGGCFKGAVFGFILASVGCYQGFNTRGGAEGVGRATTRAVVISGVLILTSDYFLTRILAPLSVG